MANAYHTLGHSKAIRRALDLRQEVKQLEKNHQVVLENIKRKKAGGSKSKHATFVQVAKLTADVLQRH